MSTHWENNPNGLPVAVRQYLLEALAREEANLAFATDELGAGKARFEAQQHKVATLRAARSVLEGSERSA